MLEAITNTGFQIVLALIGGGLLTEAVRHFFFKDRSRLSFFSESQPWISKALSNFDKLQITYDGTKLTNLYAYRVYFRNAGNTVIKNVEVGIGWEQGERLNYSFFMSPMTKIEILTPDPHTKLKMFFKIGYLNPKEDFHLNLLIGNHEGEVVVFPHGEGVDEQEHFSMESFSGETRKRGILVLISMAFLLTSLALMVFWIQLPSVFKSGEIIKTREVPYFKYLIAYGLMIPGIVLTYLVYRSRKKKTESKEE